MPVEPIVESRKMPGRPRSATTLVAKSTRVLVTDARTITGGEG
jgi:hypothetical protein